MNSDIAKKLLVGVKLLLHYIKCKLNFSQKNYIKGKKEWRRTDAITNDSLSLKEVMHIKRGNK